MKIFFDTEFHEDGKTIELISIGLVREDNAYLYMENQEYDNSTATPWLKKHVLPNLKGYEYQFTKVNIAKHIKNFVGYNPEFWAYYADYDWVTLCQLYGTMMQLPNGWPMYCRDMKQYCDYLGNPQLPRQDTVEHHALNDAKWCQKAYNFLKTLEKV